MFLRRERDVYIKATEMIWVMTLCVLAQVTLGIQQRDVYASNITWEPMQIPLVFGKDVGIRCSYHYTLSCNDHIIWTWYTGTDNELIMTNGTLSEKFKYEHKYSESTSSCFQISTLIISNFNESDYNQTYTCGFANIKQSGRSFAENIKDKITFENTSYEYMPSDEMLSTEIKLENQQMSCRVEIPRVYPLPDFQATFEGKDITNDLKIQKKKTSLFFHVSINLTIRNKSMASVGNICIRCKRTESWWYLTNSWNPNCTARPTIDKPDCSLAVCIYVLSMSYFVSSTVVILVMFFSSKDEFEMRNSILYLIDSIHFILGTVIFVGYSTPYMFASYGRLQPQAKYGYVFKICQRIGGIKLITIVVVAILAVKTYKKIKRKTINTYVAVSFLSLMFSNTVFELTLLLYKKEQNDGGKSKAPDLFDVRTIQLFIPVRLCCVIMLMMFNTTDEPVWDKIREKLAILVDSRYNNTSVKSTETHVPLMNKEYDVDSFENSETHVPLVDKAYDVESFGSSETHVPLMNKEYDVDSFENSETHVPLVDKAYDVESFGSSDSYNTADGSPNDEKMFTAETVF